MLLGIDYGKSKIGLAVVDDHEHTPALPVSILKRYPEQEFHKSITKVFVDYKPTEIIIGNPYNIFPPSKKDAEEFVRFVKTVEKISGLKAILFEETGTTKEAQHLITDLPHPPAGGAKNDDAIAASIMLQAYINNKKNASVS